MNNLDEKRRDDFPAHLTIFLSLESGVFQLSPEKIIDCYFIEDIFSYNLAGKLSFIDSEGIFEIGPFTGSESIVITYGIEKKISIMFEIWKISDITQYSNVDASAGSVISVDFVDISFNALFLRKFSKSWPVKTLYSDVATNILNKVGLIEKFGIDLYVEESLNRVEREPLCFPYWTVMGSLNYLSKRIVSKEMKTSGYLCYTNIIDGQQTINYRSMNWLLSRLNYMEKEEYSFVTDNRNDKNKIYEYSINGVDKLSYKVIKGGKWLGFDFNTKSFLTYDSTYIGELKRNSILGNYSLFSNITSSEVTNNLIGERSLYNLNQYANAEWQQRYNKQQLITITVRGMEYRYAGMLIKILKWPSYHHDNKVNDLLSGNFLIQSIKHQLARENKVSYSQEIILIKNGYENLQTNWLEKSTVKNTI